MAIFQSSVLKKYLKQLDSAKVAKLYKKYTKYFHDPTIQQNIRESKEEQYQAKFLDELFVNVLGYTLNPQPNFNLTTEFKNIKNSRKADGAILDKDEAVAVIELKGTKTKDLESIRQQAFDYKANQPSCVYVITSNFEKLRFYINNAVDFEEFDLFMLSYERFEMLYLCLHKENLLQHLPLKIKEASLHEEEAITKKFYSDYSNFKRELFRDMVKRNLRNPALKELGESSSKKELFKKTQKLLDRFLFIFFGEDRGLLPPNSIPKILEQWEALKKMDAYSPLYERYKKYFGYLNEGWKGQDYEIFAYNGGLFKPDAVLDTIEIDDDLLFKHTSILTKYDFESQVDVNILGHIFEHSLNEIESVNAEIDGVEFDKQKTKRKKDGVFYTPKYITKYIVDNTVGKLCEEKKTELDIREEEYLKGPKNRAKTTLKKLDEQLQTYRDWLLSLTICDPACGSGAFLNQALDFLITEHRWIDEMSTKLLGGGFVFPDIENSILEKNIYGVDLNDESVEIAKLSLWLRTAQKGRKLTSLNSNIKCGNSLIDSKAVAGDKAFNWEKEFPEVFAKGGFDVIIGNPPYGAHLDQKSKTYCADKFKTFQGNHEIYFFFIELLTNILKEKGEVGYITPDTWINIPQAQKLRHHVLNNYSIHSIVTFSYSVFADASVNAIVFTLKKGGQHKKCRIIHADDKMIGLNVGEEKIKEATISNWKKSNDNQFQVWQNESDIQLIDKVAKQSKQGIEFLDVCQGIVPYSTEHLTKEEIKARIYHSSEKIDSTYGRWIQGRSVKRYSIDDSNDEYLKYGEWLHRSRKPKYFNNERILIQEITGGNPPRVNAALYKDVLYHDPGIISCLNVSELSGKYLLAIINSKLISWFNLKTSPKGKRTTFPKVLIGDIRKFPIKEAPENVQEVFSNSVDKMTDLTNSYSKNINSFSKYLSAHFSIDKMSKKLQNWHDLEFIDFIKELNKTIKKAGGNPLSKLDEMEWMELFETKKKEALELKAEIDKTDREIDLLVYELYGLTDEEIKIVENS